MNSFELSRYEAGKTLKDAAAAAGVHPRTVQRLEDGKTNRPDPVLVRNLADFYGVTVAELLGVTERVA